MEVDRQFIIAFVINFLEKPFPHIDICFKFEQSAKHK